MIADNFGMTNPAGPIVSRVIRRRAYAAGALITREREVERARAALAEAIARADEIRHLIAECDHYLEAVPGIEVADIRPIQAFKKSGLFRYGELTREIIRILKDALPDAMRTAAIIADVSNALNLPRETVEERDVTRRRIVKQLQKFGHAGVIDRIPSASSQEVQWLWIGL